MTKIKHFIITRFLCNNFNHTNEELFSDEWLNNGYKLLTNHFIPTLENQTNKNFEMIFLIHNEIPIEKVQMLNTIETTIKFHILRLDELENFLNQLKATIDILITSRLDYDDNIHKCVVDDIQKYAINNPKKITIYGLNKGATIVDGETNAYLKKIKEYEIGNSGYWSAMETLILPNVMSNKLFSIYSLGNHTKVIKTLKEKYKEMGIYTLNDDYYHKDTSNDIKYLWVRHKQSQSVIVQNIWHTTDIKVDVNLFDNFGYKI